MIAAAVLAAGGASRAPAQNTRALDPADLDTNCQPCRDFFQYANGGWLARTTIPAAYPA